MFLLLTTACFLGHNIGFAEDTGDTGSVDTAETGDSVDTHETAETGDSDTGSGPVDADGDGYGDNVDCDDTSSAIYPGATEKCNGLDDDCDGDVDEVCETDTDGDDDGYGEGVDCNDDDASVYPGASEICGNGVDNDCDGSIDEGCDTGDDDADDDGYDDVDCDDANPEVNPGATEKCDGIDNDCDGSVDEGDACEDTGDTGSGIDCSEYPKCVGDVTYYCNEEHTAVESYDCASAGKVCGDDGEGNPAACIEDTTDTGDTGSGSETYTCTFTWVSPEECAAMYTEAEVATSVGWSWDSSLGTTASSTDTISEVYTMESGEAARINAGCVNGDGVNFSVESTGEGTDDVEIRGEISWVCTDSSGSGVSEVYYTYSKESGVEDGGELIAYIIGDWIWSTRY